jgi:endonuclease/exonuclease/phosphatase (EEP) superfamily protein YafD
LQSFKFKKEDYADIEKIVESDDETIVASKNIFNKMKIAFNRRGAQAEIVRSQRDLSNLPGIITGDFNDVPNSFTYFRYQRKLAGLLLEKRFWYRKNLFIISSKPYESIIYLLITILQ